MIFLLRTHKEKLFIAGILFFFILQLFSSTAIVQAQTGKNKDRITIAVENQPVINVFKTVTEKTGLVFFYNNNVAGERQKLVSIKLKNASIATLLDEIQRQTNFLFVREGNTISVSHRNNENGPTQKGKLQKIKGRVTDITNEAVIGASISVKGTKYATISNIDGSFSLEAPEGATINVTYVGYTPEQFKVTNKASYNLIMKENDEQLSEVVVVGYGSQKKVNLTGAVDQIRADVLDNKPMPNLARGLQGVIPNLNITMTDGKPIRGATYNIRGATSIGAGGESLILIDGVAGDPNLLNPNDIESVSVLKDAASAAIYGAQGAFGVILITTKSPKKDKTQITYSGSVSIFDQTVKPSFITDGYEWAKSFDEFYFWWKGSRATGVNNAFKFSQSYLDELKKRHDDPSLPKIDVNPTTGEYTYYGSTDWFHELYKSHNYGQEHSINISGSSEKVNYYVSGRYYGQDGIFRYNSDDFKMYNLRAKGSMQLFKWLKINDNFDFSQRHYTYPLTSIYEKGIWRNLADQGFPMAIMYNPDGTLTHHAAYTVGDFAVGNNKMTTRESLLKNTFGFNATFLKNQLRINGDFTYYQQTADEKRILFPVEYSVVKDKVVTEGSNQLTTVNSITDYLSTNVYAEFEKTFKDAHYFKAMVGYNYEEKSMKSVTTGRDGLLSANLPDFNLTDGLVYETKGGGYKWVTQGIFARLNYNYKERYLIEFNGRYDGSSKFPTNQRFGFFPSVSVAYRISQEPFWHLNPIFSDAKVRASYGSLGNGQVSNYQYIETMNVSQSKLILNGVMPNYTEKPGVLPNSLTWETSRTANIGIDLTFADHRLKFSGDVYRRNTLDMYTTSGTLPAVFGTTSPKGNYADMRTTGWEISLSWQDRIKLSKPFEYELRFTLSDYTSEITRYYNPTGKLSDYYAGCTVGEIWGFETEGLFQYQEEIQSHANQSNYFRVSDANNPGDWKPGDVKFRDLNNDGYVNSGNNTLSDHGDLEIIGNTTPRYQYSITLGASWNNFFFSAMFQGVGKRDWWPGAEATYFWGQYNRPYGWYPEHIKGNYYTAENPDAYFPNPRSYSAYTESSNGTLAVKQTRYLQNAAYIRLKNFTFGYNLPQKWISKIHASQLRIYVSGQNLWTWSPMFKITKNFDPEVIDGSDPEIASDKGNGNTYPMLRNFTLGLSVTF